MKYREKLMKRIMFLLLVVGTVAACGNPAGLNTKGGANIPQSQKQQEKKDDKMEKADLNALNGNIGTAAANTDLAGATFLSNEFEHNGKKMQIKLVFNKEKNICTHFINRNIVPNTIYPTAEYFITNNMITFDHQKRNKAYASVTRETITEATLLLAKEKHGSKWSETLENNYRKQIESNLTDKILEVWRKTYKAYQNNTKLTGSISADHNNITFQNFATMDFLNENDEIHIITVKNIVFTRQN